MKISDLRDVSELDEFANRPKPICEGCGNPWPDDTIEGTCRAGYCLEISCTCGFKLASMGPVGCWSCSPYRWPGIRRQRQLYRRRHTGRRWRR